MCLLQDKHAQKHHFAAAGVPVAPFADIDSEAALQAAAADFGFPLMLKSKRCAPAMSVLVLWCWHHCWHANATTTDSSTRHLCACAVWCVCDTLFLLPAYLAVAVCRFAYDGRGNFVVKSADQLAEGVAALGGFGCVYAEKWAPFVKELAVMVVRSRDGTVVSYPVVETIHKDNICHVTEAPANVPDAIQQKARGVAEHAVEALYGAGIFG